MSALLTRDNGIISLTPAATQVGKEGYGVTWTGDTATVSTSATTLIKGVIMEGASTSGKSQVGIYGMKGTIKCKLGGAVTKGAHVAQHTDGSFITDAGSGARVLCGTAMETGISGDLIEVQLFGAPVVYAS
jgi:hypothetical protein